MEKSFCFNSINGDRKYKAEDFREYFASFIGNGVFPNPSTNLQCIGENGDMTVTLKAGNGWINGALYVNDNDLILPIDVADGVLNRIDRIVLRLGTENRAINAVVKKGTFASSPVAPELQRDADAYELGIADIYIAAGATQITQANITDLRLNTSLCGIVHGTVDQVDTTTLFNQYLSWLNEKKTQYNTDIANWTAQKQTELNNYISGRETDFNTWYNNITSASQTEIDNMEAQFEQDWNNWFATVQSALDGDTAGNLLNLINENTSSITNLTEEVETEFSNLNARINNLNTNDIQVRNEIMDVKLKLKEQTAIDFVNKTGVGFYDTFADNSNIDPETTASYDSENKNVNFPSIEPYTVKATSDYNDVALINVDKAVEVGDKLNNTNPVTMVTPVDSSMTYDRTTPVSVVNSAYFTSATARPQVLSNGWIVTCAYDNANSMLHFYVSKDNGATTIPLCMAQFTANCGFAITSYGTMIYGITTFDSAGCKSFRFDATTIPNVDLATISPYSTDNIVTLDTNQISFGSGCSIAVSSTGVLTAAWCSKNATYPNSFNIRSVKSVDGGITWTKQNGTSGVDQVTADNTVGRDSTEPYVQYDKNDIPNIFISLNNNGTYYISRWYWTGTSWNSAPGGVVYNGGNYIQSNPTATLQKYGTNAGRIWVTWCGLDIDTEFYGIKISYSDDNGSTWSTMQKFASEDTYPQTSPSITSNINGYVYVVWAGSTPPNESYKNIREVIWNGISWSSVTEITLQNINSMYYPSVCDNYYNFINPIIIWQDGENTRVAFYGKWTIGTITYDITLTDSVTISENEELTLYPIEKILKMVDETFDTFNNLDLSLYTNKINKATINGAVDNSTTVITGDTDKTLTAGDKLFMNNVLNEVLNATGNFVTNTVTDATVVASAYDTSGNGGRKLVRLSNGWLVSYVFNSTNNYHEVYKSLGGDNWTKIFQFYDSIFSTISGATSCVTTDGTHIFLLNTTRNNIDNFGLWFHVIDINGNLIQSNTYANSNLFESGQSAVGACSLVINEAGTELHACWSSKNSTYPNSFNIRYCKGTINTDGSVTWGSVEQVTGANTSGEDWLYPCIICTNNDVLITLSLNSSSINNVTVKKLSQSWGVENRVYMGGSYTQSFPCAIFVPQSINGLTNGRIWVTWHGTGSSHTSVNYTFLSYSDDGGDTWSDVITIEDMASGNPTITYDKTGLVYVVYQGFGSYGFIRYKTVNNTGTVSGYTLIKDPGTYPSTLIGYTDFTIPLVIYMTSDLINFTGTWTVGEGYTLTMQNPVTLTDGDKVPIVDFSVKQGDVDLELDSIDTEKFVFKGSNLNTDNASIKVLSKDNKVNAIAYAVA